jgi:hypothetical protein
MRHHRSLIGLCCVVFLTIVVIRPAQAQHEDAPEPDGAGWDFDPSEDAGFSIGGFLRDAFTPQLITDTRHIREYLRDPRFHLLSERHGAMRTVDAIFLRSLRIADYQIARALFLSLMAVLEHQHVSVKLPIVRSLALPLTFEEDSLFRARTQNLPAHIYPDSPPEGDRDKLQHFFASAYLSFASESPDLARAGGNVVEWGEAQFIVGGADDPRDRRANRQGERFGRDLLIVKTLLPSDYLASPLRPSGELE